MAIKLPIVSSFDPNGLKQAQGALNGFKGTLKTVGVALAGAFSIRAVTDFTKGAVDAASSLEESLNAVSVSYGDASDAIVKLGEDAATRLGVSQSAFNQAAVRFSAFAERVVGEGGNVAGFVDDVTARASDFASVFNIDVSEALQVFQSGLAGEAEPLKRFGINLLQSEVQAYALRAGIIAVGEQMTEEQKVQARYGLLMESTAKTAGDFANTSDGLANSQRILKANFEDMQATVGNALLPAFASLSAGLLPVVEQLGPVLTGVMEQLAPVVEQVAGQIPNLLAELMPLVPVIGSVAEIFLQLVTEALPFFVELLRLVLISLEPLLPVILAVAKDALTVLFEIFESLMPLIADLITSILPILLDIFVALAPPILKIIEAFLPLIEMVLPLLIGLLEFLIPIFTVVAEILSILLVEAITYLIGAFEDFMAFLDPFVSAFEDKFGGIKEFFFGVVNMLIGMWEGFANGLISGVNSVIRALNRIQVDAPGWLTALTGITSFGFNLREVAQITLPRVALAEGGIVTGPLNALIGEAGPEAVIPLDRMPKGNTYNITVNAGIGTNGAQVGEQIVTAIKRYERVSGPVFASA